MYPKVEDGDYVFMVKARNSDGVESESPVTIRISISPPIWKRWWFILLSALIVLYVFYLFVKIRERNHRKMEETLKRMLDERTREVVAQKEEIERKNKDITDSINYAQRIQEAILPVKESLTAVFPDSFIYYAPRDIVSGDFYLVHSSGNKVIIVCADATGHGVPGAFVSMISVTIIKDILNRGQFNGPAEILYNLDHEICQIFNQADQKTRTTDGLDISVCEIDTESGLLTFSSAMRPILMISNESFVYVRGSKHSIGMSRHSDHKVFDEHKIQLTAGDLIYLFSDGFPDQFGGDKGKKLKISGLKDLVWSLRKSPMHEQDHLIREMFQTWKGEKAQVDDVLMIGLRYDANKKPV
jgi:serine phosphatase RsbU (regulator of sigma subunit)